MTPVRINMYTVDSLQFVVDGMLFSCMKNLQGPFFSRAGACASKHGVCLVFASRLLLSEQASSPLRKVIAAFYRVCAKHDRHRGFKTHSKAESGVSKGESGVSKGESGVSKGESGVSKGESGVSNGDGGVSLCLSYSASRGSR